MSEWSIISISNPREHACCMLKAKRHTCWYFFYMQTVVQPNIFQRNNVVFLVLFLSRCQYKSTHPLCPTGKTLEIVHLPRGRSWRPGHSFFSVRFEKIILIMILLAKRRMWLLKMDLWKNSYPQKNISQWMNPPAATTLFHPSSGEFIPSANSTQEPTFMFSRPASLKVIIPDHKYHFTFPACSIPGTLRLLRRRWFGRGINLTSTCSFCNQPSAAHHKSRLAKVKLQE